MRNIWGFLVQTLEVSSMALIILLLKKLLKDKLSPRWQYGVWTVLAVSTVMPAGYLGRYIFPWVHILLQTGVAAVENGLSSVYTAKNTIVYNTSFLPYIKRFPSSITDILFVLYIAGVVFCLARYIMQYFRLSDLVNTDDSDGYRQFRTDVIAHQYGIKSCAVRVVRKVPSAFVIGVFNPVMVIPSIDGTDDKVILHELLHVKNHDVIQNMLWSALSALHWCNPFLRHVFKEIHNDMESLCDQRVLELLEGEDRREYGKILLSMTNDKYPSAFGTSSISNGGRFISERIQAIARFKKYPQGMGIISVCIVLMLMPLTVRGLATDTLSDSLPDYMAPTAARMTSCSTVAGAIDTYAKAVVTDNPLYYLAIEPDGYTKQDYIMPQNMDFSKSAKLYYVMDLQQQSDDIYTANLLFKDHVTGLDGRIGENYHITPIKIMRQHGWKVKQTADRQHYQTIGFSDASVRNPVVVDEYTGGDSYTYKTGIGQIDVKVNKVATVNNDLYRTNSMDAWFATIGGGGIPQTTQPKPHTDFTEEYTTVKARYTFDKALQQEKDRYVAVGVQALFEIDDEIYVDDDIPKSHGSGSNSAGWSWISTKHTAENENYSTEYSSDLNINSSWQIFPKKAKGFAVLARMWDVEETQIIIDLQAGEIIAE